ncbi:MAG TPA: glycosyltransferase [Microscillaceae bacterium]|nr:glycosyltransferase [Microscillaceae bacterium]
MNQQLLLIFTKNPELGKVKTRLAKTIGDQKALEVYQYLLGYTRDITLDLPNTDKAVFYSKFIDAADLWEATNYQKQVQQGEGLGERMSNAFAWGFDQKYQSIIIVGSDCIEITQAIITEAFQALQTQDFVIGPAKDGGYYLLGMNAFYPQVFENKTWSTASVFPDTIQDLKAKSNKIHYLPQLSDVDTEKDLASFPVKFV